MARKFRKTCQCCGLAYIAGHHTARWCSSRCSMRAYQRRRRGEPEADLRLLAPRVLQPTIVDDENDLPAAWSVPPAGTEERFWQGTAIQRRQADGFVNATAMCKANRREWFTYARSARTQEYIAALKAAPQICGTEVVQSISGGVPALQGTWIHPRLAIDLARWISPAFAVWMDGWFLETIALPSAAGGPLEPGIHVVAETMAHARQLWGAMLRTELLATLDTYSVGHPSVATPKVKYHLAPAT